MKMKASPRLEPDSDLHARNVVLKRLYRERTSELQAALKRADEVAPLKEEVLRLRKANATLTARCDNVTVWGADAPVSREVARLEAHVASLAKKLSCNKQECAAAQACHNSTVKELQRRLDVKSGRLEAAEKTAAFFERKAAQYMSEVRQLHRELSVSFEALVREDVFRAIESTGNAAYFPKSLMPTLASMQDAVAPAALRRREQRLKDPGCHPSGLHPGVHENGTLVGSAMFPVAPEPDNDWDFDCDV
jgi:chromosome segregation ATPase